MKMNKLLKVFPYESEVFLKVKKALTEKMIHGKIFTCVV